MGLVVPEVRVYSGGDTSPLWARSQVLYVQMESMHALPVLFLLHLVPVPSVHAEDRGSLLLCEIILK